MLGNLPESGKQEKKKLHTKVSKQTTYFAYYMAHFGIHNLKRQLTISLTITFNQCTLLIPLINSIENDKREKSQHFITNKVS